MKRLISITVILFCYQFLFAQYESYDLSKYKLPDIKRYQLDFQFNTNGSNASHSYYSTSYIIEGEKIEPDINYNSNSFEGQGEFNYSYYRNTPRFQTSASVLTSYDYSRTDNSGNYISTVDRSQSVAKVNASYNLNYFPGNSNWFLAINPYSYFSYLKQKDYDGDVYYDDNNYTIQLGLGGGKGRIEQVQDFRHAILLLQELEKRGVANKAISEQKIFELSHLISKLKNKRFFDARKRKEADLVAVDSFLVSNGIVSDNKSIIYFTGLNDIWEFGGLQIRESGNQFKFMIRPGYQSSISKSNYDEHLQVFEIYSLLEYIIRKPISIKWQFDFSSGISYLYTNVLKEEYISTGARKNFSSVHADVNFGYYPNTRTSLYFWCRNRLSDSSDEKIIDDQSFSFQSLLGTTGYYYISERLRLEGSVYYNYNINKIFNSDIGNAHDSYLNYKLTFSYAMF